MGLGYAVHPDYRNQGRGKETVAAAIAEMKHGFIRGDQKAFCLEAVVSTDNMATQRIAALTLSPTTETGTDRISGKPALRYLRKVE